VGAAGQPERRLLLDLAGGEPHRIISGLITFGNSGDTPYFADPSPRDDSEYAQYHEVTCDTAEGGINAGRYFTGAAGDAAGRIDLLSVAAHEIGHALGLAADKTGAPSTIIATPPRPCAEALIPSFGADHLLVGQALMNPFQEPGVRQLISGVAVLAEAEISRFARPNLDPDAAVPEPGAVTLMRLGLSFVLAGRARGRVVPATRLPVGRRVARTSFRPCRRPSPARPRGSPASRPAGFLRLPPPDRPPVGGRGLRHLGDGLPIATAKKSAAAVTIRPPFFQIVL
jgi:hypothetical protein